MTRSSLPRSRTHAFACPLCPAPLVFDVVVLCCVLQHLVLSYMVPPTPFLSRARARARARSSQHSVYSSPRLGFIATLVAAVSSFIPHHWLGPAPVRTYQNAPSTARLPRPKRLAHLASCPRSLDPLLA